MASLKGKVRLNIYLAKNLGDDLFLKVMCERYKKIDFYISKRDGWKKYVTYDNVHTCCLFERIKEKIWGRASYGRYLAEVLLGGSIFIDSGISPKDLAKRLDYNDSVPTFVLGANFGPYKNEYYRLAYEKWFRKCKDVCFRDSYSASLFKGVSNVRVAPDIIFSIDPETYRAEQRKKIIISVIDLKSRGNLSAYIEQYEKTIADMANRYLVLGYEVVLMSFCKAEGDEFAIERIKKRCENSVHTYYYDGDINEALTLISSSEIVIGTRFHAIILGLVFNKKVAPIIYSDKTDNTLDDIGYNGKRIYIDKINGFNAEMTDEYLYSYGNVDEISRQSESHFEMLDKYIKGNGRHV